VTPADLFTADQATFWGPRPSIFILQAAVHRVLMGCHGHFCGNDAGKQNIHEADVHFEVGDVRRGRLQPAMTIRPRSGEEDSGQRHPLKRVLARIRVGR
jgi:hypothetical protein